MFSPTASPRGALLGRQLSLIAALSAFTACHEHHEAVEKPKYLVTSPVRKPTELTRDYVGQVRAIQHIEVRALERGYLQGIFVDEGQRITAGQKMFQIMPMIVTAELQKAQAELQRTEIELQNTQQLADKNIVSPNELALAKANFARAQAEVSLANTHKGLTEIRAPFSGIMGRFQARLGSLIDEGDLLTTLSDNSTIWVYFNVAEAEYLKLRGFSPSDEPIPVKLVMANGQQFSEPGKVETIEADFNNETGTIAFRATFPNPKGLLRHGETGKVLVNTMVDDALIVPQKATFDVLDKKFVFVIDETGAVHSRPITVSAELPQVYVVSSGLDEQERILLDGLRKVRDGNVIEPDFKSPLDVLAHLEVRAE
ncbi:MAG: efflux RND transporter periplasmic adaptor subunit [Archangium sp.]|nr:efflux RND transporter periplasmic adaptor subunit [Archangium sp.]